MLITFKGTSSMRSYHDLPHSWVDGDQREVTDESGKYLVSSFPDNFKVIKGSVPPPKPSKRR